MKSVSLFSCLVACFVVDRIQLNGNVREEIFSLEKKEVHTSDDEMNIFLNLQIFGQMKNQSRSFLPSVTERHFSSLSRQVTPIWKSDFLADSQSFVSTKQKLSELNNRSNEERERDNESIDWDMKSMLISFERRGQTISSQFRSKFVEVLQLTMEEKFRERWKWAKKKRSFFSFR